jgi:hypothetical protein
MRHSKSCSNHIRSMAKDTENWSDPTVKLSQKILDPGLTAVGRKMAVVYGPILQKTLRDEGMDLETALYGSSALHRAKETATLVFPENSHRLLVVPHFTEHGAIPENTPRHGLKGRKPDWEKTIDWMGQTLEDGQQLIAVGHGSYLRSEVAKRKTPFHNLDGILLDVSLHPVRGRPGDWSIHVHSTKYIPYDKQVSVDQPDQCMLESDQKKIRESSRKMVRKSGRHSRRSLRSRKHTRKGRRQGGGGVNMPLAYYQAGAQMQGTSATPTGVGLNISTPTMVRTPLQQSGGAKKNKNQGGGFFTPSVMGSLSTHMGTVVPIAGYMAYNMYKNHKKTHKKSRK